MCIGTPTASAFAPQIFNENRTLTSGQAIAAYAFGYFCNPNLSNGGWPFTGDIAEVIAYNRALTAAENTTVLNYLNARYFNAVQAPSCSITSPANGTNFAPSSNITITASAAAVSPATLTNVKFYQGSTLLATVSTSPYSYTWNSVAAGGYALTAVATDSNNLSTTSSAVNITVDTAPTCSITSPANNTVYTTPASITITATATPSSGQSISKRGLLRGRDQHRHRHHLAVQLHLDGRGQRHLLR